MAASNEIEYFAALDMEAQTESLGRPPNAESVAEDENELMWAAIERLPSAKRRNFALLREGATTEVMDVTKLDKANRELIVERALETSDQDNFMLLSSVKERLDK